jgi:hypothetical protein
VVAHPAPELFRNPVGEHCSVSAEAVAPGITSTMIRFRAAAATLHDTLSGVRRISTSPNALLGGRSQKRVPSVGGSVHTAII